MKLRVDTIIHFMMENQIKYELIGSQHVGITMISDIKKPVDGSLLIVKKTDLCHAEELAAHKGIIVITTEDCKSMVMQLVNMEKECCIILTESPLYLLRMLVQNFWDNQSLRIQKRDDYEDNVIIEQDVRILGNVSFGSNVIIKSGAVIGSSGFCIQVDEYGTPFRIPSQGRVVIGDNVEIGVNSSVDCGVYGDTVIGNNCMVSNLCHIAHDCIVDDNVIMAAGVVIGAESHIEKNVFIGVGATIQNRILIGEKCLVGAGAVVKRNIYNKDRVIGNPAISLKEKSLITLDRINKTFYQKSTNNTSKVLDDISFDIKKGEILAILGPSGCGKSTLLKIMAGTLKADDGSNILTDNELTKSIVQQEDALLPWFDLEKNISLGLKIKKEDKTVIKKRVRKAIEMVGLTGYEKYFPRQLSGGMKKRASIARCLIMDSELLLMDEPFGALDSVTKYGILKDLRVLQKEKQFSICMVTHDIDEAIYLADRIMILGGSPVKIQGMVMVGLIGRRDSESNDYIELKKYIKDIVNSGEAEND